MAPSPKWAQGSSATAAAHAGLAEVERGAGSSVALQRAGAVARSSLGALGSPLRALAGGALPVPDVAPRWWMAPVRSAPTSMQWGREARAGHALRARGSSWRRAPERAASSRCARSAPSRCASTARSRRAVAATAAAGARCGGSSWRRCCARARTRSRSRSRTATGRRCSRCAADRARPEPGDFEVSRTAVRSAARCPRTTRGRTRPRSRSRRRPRRWRARAARCSGSSRPAPPASWLARRRLRRGSPPRCRAWRSASPASPGPGSSARRSGAFRSSSASTRATTWRTSTSCASTTPLPLATDGWSMFHPPLFYALAALLAPLGHAALRVIPWISGLGAAYRDALAGAAAAPRRRARGAARGALRGGAARQPLQLGLLHQRDASTRCSRASRWSRASTRCWRRARPPGRRAWLGLSLGLAALAKFTALAFAPVALFFLAVKLVAIERARPARAAGLALRRAARAARGLRLVLRAQLDPLRHADRGQLGPSAGHGAWWQQPGFHTPAWYLHFGASLQHPYLAGFLSFGDGFYSTFWGDGGIGGRVNPDAAPRLLAARLRVGVLPARPARDRAASARRRARRCGGLSATREPALARGALVPV